jgi:hypothetical protein
MTSLMVLLKHVTTLNRPVAFRCGLSSEVHGFLHHSLLSLCQEEWTSMQATNADGETIHEDVAFLLYSRQEG